jgi:hypothetical protein
MFWPRIPSRDHRRPWACKPGQAAGGRRRNAVEGHCFALTPPANWRLSIHRLGDGTMKFGMTILLLALACIAAPQAWADARSDVLAGIDRCGVIHDDRVWLDCVYGANQPMRAQLGLSPAPEFQQRLVPPPQIGAVAPPMLSPPPPAQAPSRPQTSNKRPGFLARLTGDAAPAAVSRMASYRYDTNGAFIVTLENGQQWRQSDVETGKVTWLKKPADYMVTIIYGSFGTFNLRTDDNPQVYKVERLK